MAQPGTTGGLSIVPIKEIFTSQAGPIDQLTGSSGIMMLGSSRALWRHTEVDGSTCQEQAEGCTSL